MLHLSIVNGGDWLGNPANFKGVGYCSLLSKSRDNDPAHRNQNGDVVVCLQ